MSDRPLALVTGSAAGFGLLTVVELARAGFEVCATMRDPARRDGLDAALRAVGLDAQVRVLQLDVTDPVSIDRCAAQVHAEGRALSVLVNNAGYGLTGFAEDVTEAELRAQFETNFFGLVRTTQTFLPPMRAQGSGTIVNLSSGFGRVGMAFSSAYCASKFALEGWSESVRYELAWFGIRVVLVEPGAFRTDIMTRNKAVARATDALTSPYARQAQRIQAFISAREAKIAADPRLVARTVVRAVLARRPRLRWAVPGETRLQMLLRKLLPARLFEGGVQRLVDWIVNR